MNTLQKRPSIQIARDGNVIGEFKWEEIELCWMRGDIHATDYLFDDRTNQWRRISEVLTTRYRFWDWFTIPASILLLTPAAALFVYMVTRWNQDLAPSNFLKWPQTQSAILFLLWVAIAVVQIKWPTERTPVKWGMFVGVSAVMAAVACIAWAVGRVI
jgi:hypothetical protein